MSVSTLFAACKAKKNMISPEKVTLSELEVNPIAQKIKQYEQTLDSQMMGFEYLSLKVHTDYKTTVDNVSVKAQIRIKKDSLIWISVTPLLGIEVARILVRADSLFILNRIQSQVARYSIQELRQRSGYPISFPILQNLILGHTLIPLSQLQEPVFRKDSSHHILEANLVNGLESYQYTAVFSLASDVVEQLFYNPARTLKANLQYFDYTNLTIPNTHDIRIPKRHEYTIFFRENIYIHNEYSKIETNKCEFPFSIPDRYERVQY